MKNDIDELAGWDKVSEKKCENCGWWIEYRYSIDDTTPDTHVCDRVGQKDSLMNIIFDASPSFDGGDAWWESLETSPDFYCNEWKAKG